MYTSQPDKQQHANWRLLHCGTNISTALAVTIIDRVHAANYLCLVSHQVCARLPVLILVTV